LHDSPAAAPTAGTALAAEALTEAKQASAALADAKRAQSRREMTAFGVILAAFVWLLHTGRSDQQQFFAVVQEQHRLTREQSDRAEAVRLSEVQADRKAVADLAATVAGELRALGSEFRAGVAELRASRISIDQTKREITAARSPAAAQPAPPPHHPPE
jgi:hypothetical protein